MRKLLAFPVIALLCWCALVPVASAECERLSAKPATANQAPDLDGPGSFGPLHGTVTLDCLKYVGSIQMRGVEHVLIRDEEGAIHGLQVGDPMGENGGVISSIDNNTIYVRQHVKRAGKWHETTVKFPKKAN